jgi:rhodanese-related sulfurtransferase
MEQLGTFATNHWELFVGLAVILVLLAGTYVRAAVSGVAQVSPGEATQLINHNNAVVLDVREDKEYADGHILNSVHVPLGNLKDQLGRLEKYRTRHVIVSCRSGNRSASACATLRKHGFENVFNLKGGVLAWQSASLPLSKTGKK